MKSQILFAKKRTKNITSLSSAEFAQSMISVNLSSSPKVHGTFTYPKSTVQPPLRNWPARNVNLTPA